MSLAVSCATGPPRWPEVFTLAQRRIPDTDSGLGNATTLTFYDWQRQANLILITPDTNASDVLHDLELGTRHSFYFNPSRQSCFEMDSPSTTSERSRRRSEARCSWRSPS